jgi:hypothetical protein
MHSQSLQLNDDANHSPLPWELFCIHCINMKCIPFYSNIARQLKGRGMKNKRISVGYMFKLIPHSTSVSKCLQQKRYAQL